MKNFLLRFWPILFILVLWGIFATPYFLQHKVPFPSTFQVTFFPPWSAYPQFAQPVKNNAMPDLITQIYPWKFLVVSLWKTGNLPLWNPYSFGGTPLLANYQSAVLTPINLLFIVLPFVTSWTIAILLQPLLAGVFMYIFTQSLKVSKSASLLSSIGFMFCGFMTVWMAYGTLGYALLFLPLSLYAIEKYFQTAKFRYAVLLALSLPLSFFSGHFQISLYVLVTILVYLFYKALSVHAYRRLGVLAVFLVAGIFLCLPQLLPSLEFYTNSVRSNLFQKLEVIPFTYLPTLFAPDIFGNPVTRNDWLGHYAEWNMFVGVIPLLFAFFSLVWWRKKDVTFFLVLAIVTLLIALPTPLGDMIVFLHIPVLATSAMSRIVGVFSFALCVLAGFGYDAYKKMQIGRNTKPVVIWMGSILTVFVILWSMVIFKLFIPLVTIAIAKQNIMLPSIFACSLLLITTILLAFPKKNIVIVLSLIILLITSFDMYRFVTKWLPFDSSKLVFPEIGVTKQLHTISNSGRAIGNYDAQVPDYYQVEGLEGYDPLYIGRYGEFIASVKDGMYHQAERSVVNFPKATKHAGGILSLLNVEYVIHKKSDDGKLWTFPYWQYPSSDFSLLFEDDAYRVLKNNNAFPRAFFVDSYAVKKDKQDILDALYNSKFDLRKQVVLEEDPKNSHPELACTERNECVSGSQDSGQVRVTDYSADKVQLDVTTSHQSLLFLSDPYYPGWKAYVDGKGTSIYRADYAFRAIVVPAGQHSIVFSYFPMSFALGLLGAGVGVVILIVSTFILPKKNSRLIY